MKGRQEWRDACVVRTDPVTPEVRLIEFEVEGDLPPYTPGSHINVAVSIDGREAVRSYSCLPTLPGRIRIAVKHHDKSRGGSRFMWALAAGAMLRVTVPENRFELSWRAPAYLLVAGGIGITPILGMAMALAARKRPVRLLYAVKTREQAAFGEDLSATLGEDFAVFAGGEGRRIDLAAEIAALAPEGELYICGPLRMLDAAKQFWGEAGRPMGRLRFEVFGDSGAERDEAFTVRVLGDTSELTVLPGKCLLDTLEEAGVDTISDCRRGECGLCAVDVVELTGRIDHRDVFFSEAEKRENKRLCTCVSRVTGGGVVIDTGHRIS
jgi:vanillate O-demethylase ferredoxin subunit